jgi:hypothetical protein
VDLLYVNTKKYAAYARTVVGLVCVNTEDSAADASCARETRVLWFNRGVKPQEASSWLTSDQNIL